MVQNVSVHIPILDIFELLSLRLETVRQKITIWSIDDIYDIESYIDFENGYMLTKDDPETYSNPERLNTF